MAVRNLEVAVRERNGAAVIDLAGDVNATAEQALTGGYTQATAGGASSVILNFAGADYINSTGIALIVGLLAQARTQGVQMAAYGLSEHYREIFEITRLADFMTIAESEESAVNGAEGNTNG